MCPSLSGNWIVCHHVSHVFRSYQMLGCFGHCPFVTLLDSGAVSQNGSCYSNFDLQAAPPAFLPDDLIRQARLSAGSTLVLIFTKGKYNSSGSSDKKLTVNIFSPNFRLVEKHHTIYLECESLSFCSLDCYTGELHFVLYCSQRLLEH